MSFSLNRSGKGLVLGLFIFRIFHGQGLLGVSRLVAADRPGRVMRGEAPEGVLGAEVPNPDIVYYVKDEEQKEAAEVLPPCDHYGYPKSFKAVLHQTTAACVKNVSLFCFGNYLGFVTILIPALREGGSDPDMHLTAGQLSWIGSINLMAIPFGCLFSGYLSMRIGRRRAMQLVSAPFILSWIVIHQSTTVVSLYAGFLISGFAAGLLEAPVMVYVAEISQPHLRGILSSTGTMSIMLAMTLQFVLGAFFTWRQVALMNLTFPILSFVLLFFIPESPYWLMFQCYDYKAMRSLQWLRGLEEDSCVNAELIDIRKTITFKESMPKLSFFQSWEENKKNLHELYTLYSSRSFVYPFVLLIMAFFLLHFCGLTPTQTYAVVIFELLDVPIDAYYATVTMGVVGIVGICMFMALVKTIGKRPLVMMSSFGSGAMLVVVAVYVNYAGQNVTDLTSMSYNSTHVCYGVTREYFPVDLNCRQNETNAAYICDEATSMMASRKPYCRERQPSWENWPSFVALVVFALICHAGIRILPWALMGEIFPMETRSTASALSAALAHLLGFAANKLFLGMVGAMSLAGTQMLFAAICFAGGCLQYVFLPETEGYKLSDITKHFTGEQKLPNAICEPNPRTERDSGRRQSSFFNPLFSLFPMKRKSCD